MKATPLENRPTSTYKTFYAPLRQLCASMGCSVLGVLAVMMACASLVYAEWGRTADDYIRLPLGSPPTSNSALCSDLNGGCWVAGDEIGLCHVDRLGNLTFGDTALWFREPSFGAKLVPDDSSSVIVAMVRAINDTTPAVYLNRVNTARELLWGEDGIPMRVNNVNQWLYGLFPGPAANTFLVHWGMSNRYLQLINGGGEMLWGMYGIRLLHGSENARILVTNDNCVIAVHSVDSFPTQNPLVEVIKFNADGEQLWQRRYAITSELEPTLRGWALSDVESDRDGGVIISTMYKRFNDQRDSLRYFSLGIMRVSGDGDSIWTHKVYERQIEPIEPDRPGSIVDPFEQCQFILNYAGLGHYFAAWVDNLRHSDNDLFKVISFDGGGDVFWHEPIDVIISQFEKGNLKAVDSDSAVCYLWSDYDLDRENRIQQWGQRIGLNGDRIWGNRGIAIISRTTLYHSATTDGNGGVISTVDFNFPALQMMNRNGEIGAVLDPVEVKEDFDESVQIHRPTTISIYPNPGNSYLHIKLSPVVLNEAINYRIYDLIGRSVMAGTIRGFPYLVKDLSGFSSGEYILRLESPRMTITRKFYLVK